MACAWLTYAWVDNDSGDVDFVAQELQGAGLVIKIDKWTVGAGKRLWEEIGHHIEDEAESDAWLLYATQNSLTNERCREELYYALDRALNVRGNQFPLVGIFPASVDRDLIPLPIRTRLYVSLADSQWVERVVATAEGRTPAIISDLAQPYLCVVHEHKGNPVIELRPRAGTWAPFIACIPADERETVRPSLYHGPSGVVPSESVLWHSKRGPGGTNNEWWCTQASNEATPTQSYFIRCQRLPTRLHFGVPRGVAYNVRL